MATLHVSTTGSNTSPYDTWAKAATVLATAVTAAAAGDVILVDSVDTQTLSAATTYSCNNGIQIISANTTTSQQEVGAIIDFTSTAVTAELRVSSANASYVSPYIYGITFKIGKTGVTHSVRLSGVYDACTVERVATATFSIDQGALFRKCTYVNAAGVTSAIGYANSSGMSYHQSCTFFPSGGVPTYVFAANNGLFASGCDFSTCTAIYNSTNASGYFQFVNCKLHPSFSYTAQGYNSNPILEYFSCSSGDKIYDYVKISFTGIASDNTGVYLTSGGATFLDQDGTNDPMSIMCVSSANARKFYPLYSPWFSVQLTSTGSKTVSVKIAHTLAAVLKDNDAWLEVEYYGDSATPISNSSVTAPIISATGCVDTLATGSDLTDTTEAWTGITSEITHTLSKTITVAQQGFARVRVALAKASTTIYVDPQVTVS
jgi:hypothetical protein